jgi:rhodanese-related sulfurtransferase
MTTQSTPEVKQVSVQEAYEQSKSFDVRVIDIRMPFDYAGERIPGSLNLPNNAIRVRKQEVPEGKALLFLSEDGGRSVETCKIAIGLGFTDVANITGGFAAYLAAGLPTETISEGVSSRPPVDPNAPPPGAPPAAQATPPTPPTPAS